MHKLGCRPLLPAAMCFAVFPILPHRPSDAFTQIKGCCETMDYHFLSLSLSLSLFPRQRDRSNMEYSIYSPRMLTHTVSHSRVTYVDRLAVCRLKYRGKSGRRMLFLNVPFFFFFLSSTQVDKIIQTPDGESPIISNCSNFVRRSSWPCFKARAFEPSFFQICSWKIYISIYIQRRNESQKKKEIM